MRAGAVTLDVATDLVLLARVHIAGNDGVLCLAPDAIQLVRGCDLERAQTLLLRTDLEIECRDCPRSPSLLEAECQTPRSRCSPHRLGQDCRMKCSKLRQSR